MEVMHVVLHQLDVNHESIVQHEQVAVTVVHHDSSQIQLNVAVKI